MMLQRTTFEMTLVRPIGLTIRMTSTILMLFLLPRMKTNVEDDARDRGAEVRRTATVLRTPKGRVGVVHGETSTLVEPDAVTGLHMCDRCVSWSYI